MKRAAMLGRASVSSMWVKFVDVSVTFDTKTSALVECTVEGRIQEIGSERGYQARYVEIEMVKQDGKWLIAGMKEVKALE